jgi:hypothetical protein
VEERVGHGDSMRCDGRHSTVHLIPRSVRVVAKLVKHAQKVFCLFEDVHTRDEQAVLVLEVEECRGGARLHRRPVEDGVDYEVVRLRVACVIAEGFGD